MLKLFAFLNTLSSTSVKQHSRNFSTLCGFNPGKFCYVDCLKRYYNQCIGLLATISLSADRPSRRSIRRYECRQLTLTVTLTLTLIFPTFTQTLRRYPTPQPEVNVQYSEWRTILRIIIITIIITNELIIVTTS